MTQAFSIGLGAEVPPIRRIDRIERSGSIVTVYPWSNAPFAIRVGERLALSVPSASRGRGFPIPIAPDEAEAEVTIGAP